MANLEIDLYVKSFTGQPLKNRPDESDEEIINAILDGQIDPEPISDKSLNRMKQARKDYKVGKCQMISEVMTELKDSFEYIHGNYLSRS